MLVREMIWEYLRSVKSRSKFFLYFLRLEITKEETIGEKLKEKIMMEIFS